MPELRPITQKEAFTFIKEHHRHHDVPVGALWWHGAHDDDGSLCGVSIVGRTIARKLDDGLSCEVTRLCTNGEFNACSLLYGASRRVAIDKGFRRGITYILESENGASLRASGWRFGGISPGNSCNVATRARIDKHPLGPKHRYLWGSWPEFDRQAAQLAEKAVA